MYRSRVSYGSVAASAAMICVLSLVPSVVNPIGGFFALPLAHAQCCTVANSSVSIPTEAEPLVAWIDPADRTLGRVGGSDRTRGIINSAVRGGQREMLGVYVLDFSSTSSDYSRKTNPWRLDERASARHGMPAQKMAELTAGAAPVAALWGPGRITEMLALVRPAASLDEPPLRQLEHARWAPDAVVASLLLGRGETAAHREFNGGSDMAVATDTTVTGQSTASNDDAADSGAARETGGESTSGKNGEFSGSTAPSGPNLTTSEEKEIIVKGWK